MFAGYKYFYYRLYTWNLRTWGRNDVPEYNALFGHSVLTLINLYNLGFLLSYVFSFDVFGMIGWGKLHVIALFSALVAINVVIFVRDKRYLKMAKEFQKEDKASRTRNFYFCVSYAAISIATFFGLIYLR